MKCIESDIGQNSENLADALNRTYTQDGRFILQVLHQEGILKKVQTSQVVMTPSPSTRIKLEELNKILDEMQMGEAAVKKLAELDKSQGIQHPADIARRMRGDTKVNNSVPGALGDSDLARQRLEQATKMEREANGLLAEATRLKQEAMDMDPSLKPKSTRGRPKKVVATA
jgi:hypothetical protein